LPTSVFAVASLLVTFVGLALALRRPSALSLRLWPLARTAGRAARQPPQYRRADRTSASIHGGERLGPHLSEDGAGSARAGFGRTPWVTAASAPERRRLRALEHGAGHCEDCLSGTRAARNRLARRTREADRLPFPPVWRMGDQRPEGSSARDLHHYELAWRSCCRTPPRAPVPRFGSWSRTCGINCGDWTSVLLPSIRSSSRSRKPMIPPGDWPPSPASGR